LNGSTDSQDDRIVGTANVEVMYSLPGLRKSEIRASTCTDTVGKKSEEVSLLG